MDLCTPDAPRMQSTKISRASCNTVAFAPNPTYRGALRPGWFARRMDSGDWLTASRKRADAGELLGDGERDSPAAWLTVSRFGKPS